MMMMRPSDAISFNAMPVSPLRDGGVVSGEGNNLTTQQLELVMKPLSDEVASKKERIKMLEGELKEK
jgi:hypothetical protein